MRSMPLLCQIRSGRHNVLKGDFFACLVRPVVGVDDRHQDGADLKCGEAILADDLRNFLLHGFHLDYVIRAYRVDDLNLVALAGLAFRRHIVLAPLLIRLEIAAPRTPSASALHAALLFLQDLATTCAIARYDQWS